MTPDQRALTKAGLQWLSVLFGLASGVLWVRAALVKRTIEEVRRQRTRNAERRGEKPDFSMITFYGPDGEWVFFETLNSQAVWNASAGIASIMAVLCQAGANLI